MSESQKAFEQWAKENDYPITQAKLKQYRYQSIGARCAWTAWEAAWQAKDTELTRLRAALNPRQWTQAMHDAWHKTLPDTQAAFEALTKEALNPSPEPVV